MNFVQLCQAVARETGGFPDGEPKTVVGQTGPLSRIVAFTADAWHELQVSRRSWLFRRKELTMNAAAGVQRLSAPVPDFSDWLLDTGVWAHDPSVGLAGEYRLSELPYDSWLTSWGRGASVQGRPGYFAIAPDRKLCLAPIPDTTYVIRAEYVRSPQTLVSDNDIPFLPEEYHPAIVYLALHKWQAYDEAPGQIAAALARYRVYWEALVRDQLPTVGLGDRNFARWR